MLTKKGQSALEYMMTYGWAILIIVIVAVILYSMGIFNPSSSVTFTSSGFSPFIISSSLCTSAGLKIAVQTGPLPGSATSAKITKAYITSVTGGTIKNSSYSLSIPVTLTLGSVETIVIPSVICQASGTKYTVAVNLQYSTIGSPLPQTVNATGTIAGTVTPYFVANFTNSSNIAVPGTSSTAKIWNGGHQYTLAMWVNMQHSYGACGYPCVDLFQTNQGCTSGLEQQKYNSTGYEINLLEWNASCGTGATAQGSPYQYVPYNRWELITGIFNYNSQGNAWIASCVDTTCTNSSWALNQPAVYSTPGTELASDQINGQVADVQMYDITLNSNQIAMLYKQGYGGLPVTTNGLIAWLPLDGNANDYSGNNNNGVATNVQWVSP